MTTYQVRPMAMDRTKVEIDLVLPDDLGVITLSHEAPPGGHTNNVHLYISEMLAAGASVAARKDVNMTLNLAVNRPTLFGLPMSS